MLLIKDLRAIATYRRVSKKEQSDNAPAYKRQEWDLEQECKKYPDRERLIFEDIQSGRKDSREGFEALIKAIEADRVGILIVTQINRITRDSETNARLQKLLESKKVLVYEIFRGRFLDWSNPEDWEYFVKSGVAGEKESRTLSRRLKQTQQWYESQGKFCYGRVGFPYRRSDEAFIEPDPDNWQKGIECIKIVIEENGAIAKSLNRINNSLHLNRTRVWLSDWIRSPLLRGHTVKNTRDERGYKKNRSQHEIVPCTHPSLFDDPQLVAIDALKQLDRIIEDNGRYKGQTRKYQPRPLSGLVFCGRCGESCTIKLNGLKPDGSKYCYVMCSGRDGKARDCGGTYGTLIGQRRTVNTPYPEVEAKVVVALCNRAVDLVDLAIKQSERKVIPELPEAIELRAQIAKLTQANDPDLAEAIAIKQQRLAGLSTTQDSQTNKLDRERFIKCFADPEVFIRMPDNEKRELFLEWVRKVTVDCFDIEVTLKI